MQVTPHHSRETLESLLRTETNGKVVRRLQIILGAIDGKTADQISELVSLSDRAIHTWLSRYNQNGLDGLQDKSGRGRKGPLNPEQMIQFKQRLLAGPKPEDQTCALRGLDAQKILRNEFGVTRKLQSVYNLMHKLGLSLLCPRPQHPDADPKAQEEFKKNA